MVVAAFDGQCRAVEEGAEEHRERFLRELVDLTGGSRSREPVPQGPGGVLRVENIHLVATQNGRTLHEKEASPAGRLHGGEIGFRSGEQRIARGLESGAVRLDVCGDSGRFVLDHRAEKAPACR